MRLGVNGRPSLARYTPSSHLPLNPTRDCASTALFRQACFHLRSEDKATETQTRQVSHELTAFARGNIHYPEVFTKLRGRTRSFFGHTTLPSHLQGPIQQTTPIAQAHDIAKSQPPNMPFTDDPYSDMGYGNNTMSLVRQAGAPLGKPVAEGLLALGGAYGTSRALKKLRAPAPETKSNSMMSNAKDWASKNPGKALGAAGAVGAVAAVTYAVMKDSKKKT